MAKHPAERFADPLAMRQAIDAAMATASRTAPPSPSESATIQLTPARAPDRSKITDRHEHAAPHATPSPQPATSSGSHSALEATVPLMRLDDAPGDALVGDLADGLGGDWLCLDGDGLRVLLYARPRLVLGKFKDLSVDVCLRNYPVDDHKDSLQKLSRAHLALAYDAARGQVQLEDLDSINGTTFDGDRLAAKRPQPLTPDRDHHVTLAKVVKLDLRVLPARDLRREPVAGHALVQSTQAGLDAAHRLDAVVITRTENRQQLAYAMVIRRLSVGGPAADLALPGVGDEVRCEIGRLGGKWIWRTTAAAPWRPLAAGGQVALGAFRLSARLGNLGDF
jgi:hypothetical protein